MLSSPAPIARQLASSSLTKAPTIPAVAVPASPSSSSRNSNSCPGPRQWGLPSVPSNHDSRRPGPIICCPPPGFISRGERVSYSGSPLSPEAKGNLSPPVRAQSSSPQSVPVRTSSPPPFTMSHSFPPPRLPFYRYVRYSHFSDRRRRPYRKSAYLLAIVRSEFFIELGARRIEEGIYLLPRVYDGTESGETCAIVGLNRAWARQVVDPTTSLYELLQDLPGSESSPWHRRPWSVQARRPKESDPIPGCHRRQGTRTLQRGTARGE